MGVILFDVVFGFKPMPCTKIDMIAVKFGKVGCVASMEAVLPKTTQLRDVQKDLCDSFKERFPKKLASLKVYDKTYDDFMDCPFEDVLGEQIEVLVTFQDTKDPYFYDLIDRKMMKYTIEEEMEWEFQTARGETCLTFVEWLKAKNAHPLSEAIPEW